MIERIEFKNFKVLRDAVLPLGRFTLLIGPNGSGKTTVLQALAAARAPAQYSHAQLMTAGVQPAVADMVQVRIAWGGPVAGAFTVGQWLPGGWQGRVEGPRGVQLSTHDNDILVRELSGVRLYALDAQQIAREVTLQRTMELHVSGAFLAGVLDRLRDDNPERFEAVNSDLARWLPEFDRVLFDTPGDGKRAIKLRTKEGGHAIPATDLSQGTLLALAMLTLAYLPSPPSVVCLEEPDRGLHPRLLRDVRDALYRLAYPDQFGEARDPVQVIATTHSPYMLDLFKDHLEEIVIANKVGQEARFERLCDRPDMEEILQDAHLGDLWYSGILGGVPSEP